MLESLSGRMRVCSRAIASKTKLMAMGDSFMPMEIAMKVIGSPIRHKDLVRRGWRMARFTEVSGKMTCNMARVWRFGQKLARSIFATMFKDKNKVMDS